MFTSQKMKKKATNKSTRQQALKQIVDAINQT